MAYSRKTKAELLGELEALRAHVKELEQARSSFEEAARELTPELTEEEKPLHRAIVEREDGKQALARLVETLRSSVEELKIAEAELRRQNEELAAARLEAEKELHRYLDLFESVPDSYIITDADGIVREANRIAEATLNIPRERLIGRPLLRSIGAEKRTEFMTQLSKVKTSGHTERFELVIQPRERDPFPAEIIATLVRTSSDEDESIRWLICDITDRKLAEERLARHRELLQKIFDNVPVLFVLWDPHLELFVLNRHAERVLGWTTADASQADFMAMVYPDPAYRAEVAAFMQSLESGWREWKVTTKHGEQIPIDWANIRLTDDTMVGIGVDLRERKQAEQALRESEARLRNLSESLEETVRQKTEELLQTERLVVIGQMVSTVAHEVRNPIQVIRTGVDGLRLPVNEDERQELLDEVEYGASLLEGTISDLLEYARPLILEFSFAPLREILEGALKQVSKKLKYINVSVELEQADIQLHVDSTKLQQALVNILSNAADAMPTGGSLTILSKTVEIADEKFLQISITDTGVGIHPDRLDEIFKPFFTTKTRGTGLGLALCKRIVDEHCGSIEIRSALGQGTTVDMLLPLF